MLLALTVIACTKDENAVNTAPSMSDQSFQVTENSPNGTNVGTITASDNDGDNISFFYDGDSGFAVNPASGVITVTNPEVLDFESQQSISFTVTASDGQLTRNATITVSIIDVDDGPLSNIERELLDYIPYLALGQDATSGTMTTARRWIQPFRLYLFGSISSTFITSVQEAANTFNTLSTATNFEMELVDNSGGSNVELFRGTKAELQSVWPDIYDIVQGSSFTGYAIYSFGNNNDIDGGRIWMENDGSGLLKHELGHVLGWGHSDKCGSEERSIMCPSAGSDFIPIDREAFRYYYHADVPTGLNESALRATLEQVFIDG